MNVQIVSTTDTPEAVTEAMSTDLAGKKVDDKKPVDKPSNDPVVDEPTDKPVDEPTDEVIEDEAEGEEEEIEEDDEDTEVLEAKKDEIKPKKKGGFQKKIGKLEQEKEYWRQEALRAQSQKQTPETKVDTKPELSTKPNPDNYKTVSEYDDAVFDWKYEQKRSREIAKEREDAVKSEVQTKISKHDERVEEFKKSHEDFRESWEEAVEMVGAQNLSLTVREAIINSESGPALMYELANDPKEFKRICQLTPISAAMALGKIEARIKPSTTSENKQKKTVPKPITPVRTKGTKISRDISDPNLSQRDYEKLRNEQIRQRQQGRV